MGAGKIRVGINNRQSTIKLPVKKLRHLIQTVLSGEGVETGQISVAVVDDPTMHELNRKYLNHDYTTDVLSFLLEREGAELEGEIILSADTAAHTCGDYKWSAEEELMLYLVHGLLHLVGYDDHSPRDRKQMRAKETEYLVAVGINPVGVARARK